MKDLKDLPHDPEDRIVAGNNLNLLKSTLKLPPLLGNLDRDISHIITKGNVSALILISNTVGQNKYMILYATGKMIRLTSKIIDKCDYDSIISILNDISST